MVRKFLTRLLIMGMLVGQGAGLLGAGGGVAGDPLDINVSNPQGGSIFHTISFDFHHFSAALGAADWLRTATFLFRQGFAIENVTDELVLDTIDAALPVAHRWRAQRTGGNEVTSSSFFPTNLAIGVWSVWRGGVTVPTQRDQFAYTLFAPGSIGGTWKIQIEEEVSTNLIFNRTVNLQMTMT